MANAFYSRGASFNPDELADGDAIEAEFDSVGRGFDTIEDLVNANKAGYPSQTFHVAPATEPTHAIQQAQLDAQTHVSADITDATSIPTPNVLVKRDVNGDIGARNFVGGLVGNADSASRAVGNTFFTASSDSEGQIGTKFNGHNPTYLFNNASNWGVFCADGGMAFNFSYSTGLFRFYGTANEALKVTDVVPIGEGRNLVYAQMGGNNFFRIRAYSSSYDQGEVEIATADGGNEPIHVRQYDGVFSSVRRTLTLLDGSGNTNIPGIVTAAGYGAGGMGGGLYPGNGDASNQWSNNVKIASPYGIGFSPTITGQPVPYGEYSHWFNTRNGDMGCRGTITANFFNGRAYPARPDGEAINFYWAAQGGQPPWLWGGSDGINMYVYNPSNFSVNYANTSGWVNTITNNVAVLTGDIWHGNWLPIPAGYAESQCKFFISPRNTNPYGNAWDLQEGLNTQHYSVYCYLENTRKVFMRTRVYNDITENLQWHDGIVNYIVVGVK